MSSTSLTRLQIDVARAFFALPESVGFVLAGGAALIAQGLVARETDDLDFFAGRSHGDVALAADALATACSAVGCLVETIGAGPEFRRLKITRAEAEELYVDLAIDSPPDSTPTVTLAGPTLAPRDLAIRKTLALFSRAEPRDFADVYVMHRHFERGDLLAAVAEADPGFEIDVFIQMLRAHRRLRDEDFPAADVDVETLRTYFDRWADELR